MLAKSGWRLLLVITFLILMGPFTIAALLQMITAGFMWLTGREVTDKFMLGPPISWAVAPLDYLSEKAKG